jgi:hypothetical protein
VRDHFDQLPGRLVARPGAALPVARLLIGKPVAVAAAILPRLFNLCRAAQEVAATQALGLPDTGADIGAEITRDHLLKLFVTWPGQFGASPRLSPDMMTDKGAARDALFGAAGLPQSADDMRAFLRSGLGVAPLLEQIAACFAPDHARADALPLVDAVTAFQVCAVENSPAGRRADHPALRHIEARAGRGPLWRAAGRAVDLALILDGDLPAPVSPCMGTALVPATRGTYAVSAQAKDGIITGFARVTPTDHLTAKDGVLDRTLANLPADRRGLAPLILDILDPCSPVRLEEARHA